MTRTDNLVHRAILRMTKSLSNMYDDLLEENGSEEFYGELRQLDVGLTDRLGRRPISTMEIDTVSKKAELQFKAMCLRERKRGKDY